MAQIFVLWLHGLGDSGPANEAIKTDFTSPELKAAKWLFPTAPSSPVTCNRGMIMPSWFDVHELPLPAEYHNDEAGVLRAVERVHAIIDGEISAGIDPSNVFVCGLSQGGALTLASVLLYPKTLGGGAVLSGWVPFSSSMINRFTPDAKKTPMLWAHGSLDRLIPFTAGEDGVAFLKKAGVHLKFKKYPDLGHSLCNEELLYLESWIKKPMQTSSSRFKSCFKFI